MHTVEVESKYDDRAVTVSINVHDPLVTIRRTRGDGEMLFAYLSPRGARQMIDALEPFAAPKVPARPPIDVIDVLNERLLP